MFVFWHEVAFFPRIAHIVQAASRMSAPRTYKRLTECSYLYSYPTRAGFLFYVAVVAAALQVLQVPEEEKRLALFVDLHFYAVFFFFSFNLSSLFLFSL